MLTRRSRIALVLAVAVSATASLTQGAAANEDALSCWTRGAYLTAAGSFGHKAVCNRQHGVVVTLKRDTVPIKSYIWTQNTLSISGNYISESSVRFNVECGRRYQVVVQVYPQPMPVGDGPAAATQYWTSGTPRMLCQPVASSISSPPGS